MVARWMMSAIEPNTLEVVQFLQTVKLQVAPLEFQSESPAGAIDHQLTAQQDICNGTVIVASRLT